jgi:Tol biopolymer transport system component
VRHDAHSLADRLAVRAVPRPTTAPRPCCGSISEQRALSQWSERALRARCIRAVHRLLALGLVALLCLLLQSAAGTSGSAAPWRLAYATETAGRRGLDVYVVRVPGGKPVRVAGVPGRNDFSPSWSPDGRRLAYRLDPLRGDEGDILVVPARGGAPKNLTRSPGVADWSPAWSPDGRRIAFFSMRGGGMGLWLMRADGTGARRLTRSGSLDEYPTWSPDGRRVAFQSARLGEFEVLVTSTSGGAVRNLSRNPASDKWPAWSPDGRAIAFVSDRDGSEDVFVAPAGGGGGRQPPNQPHLQESHPAWSPTGELTFSRHADSGPIELWAVAADGSELRRLETTVEPVFVFGWAPR